MNLNISSKASGLSALKTCSKLKKLNEKSTIVKIIDKNLNNEEAYKTQEEETNPENQIRRLFKYFKQRSTPPDLSKVIDLRDDNPTYGIFCRTLQNKCLNEEAFKSYNFNKYFMPFKDWTYSTIESRPGLYVFNGILRKSYQLALLSKCLLKYPEPPNVTNLSAHSTQKNEQNIYKNYKEKLRWVTMGNDYDWTEKVYAPKPRASLPEEITDIAKIISKALGLGEMSPDALIINYYPEKATLSPHVDRSERDMERPLISVSLGQSAIYLTGGTTLDTPVDPILLHSGDVLVMHAEQRLGINIYP